MDAFGLDRPHAIGPDVGTPALLFAAANHPGRFRSLVIGSGATDHNPRALPRLAGRLGEIHVPCQIIVGRHDPFVPVSNAEGLHKGLPKSKLDILECGHFAWEDGAAEYSQLASEWIKGGFARL
jgi:pimeloyl-ACP methyl ester carboxylesterase